MAQKINSEQIETQESWIAPTLAGAWVNFGAGFSAAGYMKDSLGFVHMRGMVKSGTGLICTLPVGYRPSGTLYISSATSGTTPGIINVSSTGTVTMDGGSSSYISLSNVIFKAEA